MTKPVDGAVVMKLFEAFAGDIVGTLKKAFTPRDERLAALEQRIAELEDTALRAGATWERGKAFGKNATVTFDGSLWRCVEAHTSGATFSHEHFVLVVKHGRDGR